MPFIKQSRGDTDQQSPSTPPQVTSDDEAAVPTTADAGSPVPDQDDVQAVLQPAMSRAASHYTSLHTPAVEKAAAIESGSGFFDQAVAEMDDNDANDDDDDGEDGDRTPQAPSSPKNETTAPSANKRSQQARSVLVSAFGPTRHHRSRSAGQEALKRLRGAMPSWGASSNFLPSLPTNFFNSKQQQQNTTSSSSSPPPPPPAKSSTPQPTAAPAPATAKFSPNLQPRPGALRRVTSDDSLIYHSLSRQSSLGDDDRFQDVREMVNIRLMAIKDSLPDVPNFKMPSLARLQATARKSQLSLNGIFSSDSPSEAANNTNGNGNGTPRDMPDSQPSPPTATSEKPKDESATLDQVLDDLTGDLVILGGYRGSVLRSAEAPHHQLWAPVKLGLNLRKADLEVGLDDADEDSMPERIIPSGMLKNIGPIDISRKFFKKLRSCANAQNGSLRIWDFGYDWRLSPHRASAQLQEFLAGLPSNLPGVVPESRGAIVIAHSLGGLITRHAVNQRPDLFAGVLFAGVPQRCINILGPLRNGDAVLFNEKLLTARVNFSIRTTFALLPDDGFCFVNKHTGEEYPVDFLDPESWVRWRFSPCLAPTLPAYDRPAQTSSSPLTSIFPNPFVRQRSDSNKGSDRKNMTTEQPLPNDTSTNIRNTSPPPRAAGTAPTNRSSSPDDDNKDVTASLDPEQKRNYEYLARTLRRTREFRAEMAHQPNHSATNAYPPLAVLYGKTIPTVYAAGVSSREGIACADAYDDLAFRPGDGVVLARAAMLPDGYEVVRGGRVSSERGHITLLGDMPAIGKALGALVRGRRKGIGLGMQ